MNKKFTKSIFAIMCTMLMIAMSFQTVTAEENIYGNDADVITDNNGILHKVWKEPVNGTYQVFYSNDIEGNIGIASEGVQITSSSTDVMYPQIAIDPISEICYVLWIIDEEDGSETRYIGSNDFINWTESMYGCDLPPLSGSSAFDMDALDKTLILSWSPRESLSIYPDLDGDLIPDIDDANPFDYDFIGDIDIIPDAVSVNQELGVSVAIDYDGDSDIKPSITCSDSVISDYGLDIAVDITTDSELPFLAYIKIVYDVSTLSENITENYLRIYWLNDGNWTILLDNKSNEDTNIDIANNTVWGITNHFTAVTAADSSAMDSDEEGLTDAEEIGADGAPEALITTFSPLKANLITLFDAAAIIEALSAAACRNFLGTE